MASWMMLVLIKITKRSLSVEPFNLVEFIMRYNGGGDATVVLQNRKSMMVDVGVGRDSDTGTVREHLSRDAALPSFGVISMKFCVYLASTNGLLKKILSWVEIKGRELTRRLVEDWYRVGGQKSERERQRKQRESSYLNDPSSMFLLSHPPNLHSTQAISLMTDRAVECWRVLERLNRRGVDLMLLFKFGRHGGRKTSVLRVIIAK
ncbi:hypothetical protein SISNIDRAFT_464620 [Sistotremastrum niveocremeum HHB9708]|uniref:Uncharacterized protein n=1 Tax=Sistotremastrum niveocremeum HHB9708 TaxID=1314777 RepID=A0A164X4F5_9AGAM|nr:hypothetical protein SISNIDRAFT_464620 [Sistotremastrum niveocremeum HHB9708]